MADSTEISRIDLLARAARELASDPSPTAVGRRLDAWSRPRLAFDRIRILTWNETADRLETAFSAGPDDGGWADAAVEACIAGRAAVRLPAPAESTGAGPATVAVPLLGHERVLGVVDLTRSSGPPFDDREEAFVEALVSQAALAMEIGRLREVAARQARSLERELAMAGEIQRCLLRAGGDRIGPLDVGTAYLPVTALGGDFYDFLPLDSERLVVTAGDVAGKGTPAALHAALAMGLTRGQVLESPGGPATILGRLNGALALPGVDNRFVAMLFGAYEVSTRILRLANAGFPEPILLRRGRLQRIRVRGVPLGLLPGIVYDEVEVPLETGDVVAFVSDGLQEAIDGQEQQFGDRFLVDVLCALATQRAEWIAQGLIRASTAYAGEQEAHPDDRSVVVLKLD